MIEKTRQDVTRMITVGEAARLAEFHPNHVRRLLRSGRVAGLKWGQTWMIYRNSWRAYMKEMGRHQRRGPRRKVEHEKADET